MNIAEMHVWFRQYAQQMGMQNVRSILPEQIDVLINTSILDITNQIVKTHLTTINDKVVTDSSKILNINLLTSLYKTIEVDMYGPNSFMEFLEENAHIGKLSNKKQNGEFASSIIIPDYLYIISFSLNYRDTLKGYIEYTNNRTSDIPTFSSDSRTTKYVPVRIIDDAYLSDTLNDFVLRNRIKSPIMVVYNDNTFDIYIDEFKPKIVNNVTYFTLRNNLIPYKLRMSYIDKPAKVKYGTDINEQNIDCNLPESLHTDILKHAVDLYRISVSGTLYNNQQNRQA